MKDIISKIEESRFGTLISSLAVSFVFALDLYSPPGLAVWLLYLIPLLLLPYKTVRKSDVSLIAIIITFLLWLCYFLNAPGAAPSLSLLNRSIMTLITWIVVYLQVLRISSHQNLLDSQLQLKKSEERFRLVQEHSLDGFTLFRPEVNSEGILDFVFTYENSAGAKISNTVPENVIGHTLLEVFPSSIDTQFYHSYKMAYETRRPLEFEAYYSGEGVERWLRILVVPSNEEIAVISQDITERKTAEAKQQQLTEELSLAKDQYDLLFNAVEEGFAHYKAVYDDQGKIHDLLALEINPAGAAIAGLSQSELIGRTWKQVWKRIDGELLEVFEQVDRSGRTLKIEKQSSIDQRWYQNHVSRISPGHILITFFDITERKNAEIALKESEERYRLTFEKAASGIAHIFPDGKWLMVNDKYLDMMGYTRAELNGFTFKEITHPDDLEKDLFYRGKLQKGEIDSFSIEKRYIRKDGSVKWAMLTCSMVSESTTGFRYMISVLEDITELKQLQEINENNLRQLRQEHSELEALSEELKRNQSRFERAETLAHVGSWIMDVKTAQMELSEEMKNILGIDSDTKTLHVKDYLERFVHPDDREQLSRLYQENHPQGGPIDTQYRIIRPDGTIRYIHGISGGNGELDTAARLRYGAAKDITDRRLQEMKLAEINEKLERSNKELQQFAYIASHDLQEPLRMVSSYLGLLEKRYKDRLDDNARDFIGYAVDGAKRMSSFIKDLLTYSRVTSQAREHVPTDMNEIISDVQRDLQVLIREKKASVEASELPEVMADPVQMHQLLQNLIGNAIKFHGERTPEIAVNAKPAHNGYVFSVRDNGIGIEAQYFDRIFQVFQRLHDREKYEGTGIGLAICRKIVERHGGRLWVESEIGKGTTFFFTIPYNSSGSISEMKKD